jgi:hypothetical protein
MEPEEKNCCGGAPRRTVSELFDRGYRRSRKPIFPIQGASLRDMNDLSASFSLDLASGTITDVRFHASVCITLIAYCELVVELVAGKNLREAATLEESGLVATLPDVPLLKRDRAKLAINAFRAALAASLSQTGEAA